jgi:formate dehydrogenase maturation protein FdhE
MPAVPASARIPAQRRSGRLAAAVPAAQTPSSLVKVPEAARGRCVACGSNRLTELSMTLTDGTPVRFASCRRCEHRSWSDGGETLPVESVLRKAQKHKDVAASGR